MNDIKQKKKSDKSVTKKKKWESPTIQDLSINSGTQNNVTGPTGPDGGPITFQDYTS